MFKKNKILNKIIYTLENMSVKTYYTNSGIRTQDKSPINFYLNGGRDQASVIVNGTLFTPKIFGPRASISTDDLSYSLPTGQAGAAAGNITPNPACQSYYGSDGGLGIICYNAGAGVPLLNVQSNYTRIEPYARFRTDERYWRLKNVILTKNACIRIPYIDFPITSSAAFSIDLSSQTITSGTTLTSKTYMKNGVAFRFRRVVAKSSGTDIVTLPTSVNTQNIGTVIIICNLMNTPLQITGLGTSPNNDIIENPYSSGTGNAQFYTIPGNAEAMLIYYALKKWMIIGVLP